MKPRVLLADDHPALREALGQLLADAIDLVGEVGDGRQLVEHARRLSPDVVVTDIRMPGMSGLEAMRQLKTEGSTARFIVLTVDRDPWMASEAVRAGASGYVLKQAAGEELVDAIHAVMAGRTHLPPTVSAAKTKVP